MTAPPYGFPLILFPYFYLFDVFLILFKSSYFCYFPFFIAYNTVLDSLYCNLKKVLALVLAFACAFTMFAGAAFTDSVNIKDANTEAVDTLVALGVINGYTDGSFKPNGTVTRAEMAKMIYTIRSGGNSDASAYNDDKTSFTDIGSHWARGYIKYCQSLGIIAGKSNTKFCPNDKVTAQEAAKMLLVTLGYNAEKAGLTGAGWAAKTNALADENGLLEDVNTSFTTACPRQYAAQLIYNAIFAKTVVLRDGEYTDQTAMGVDNKTVGEKYMGMKEEVGTLTHISYDEDKDEYTYTLTVTTTSASGTTTTNPTYKSSKDYSKLYGLNVKVLYKTTSNKTTVYGMYAKDSSIVASGLIGDLDKVSSDSNKIKIDGTEYKLNAGMNTNQLQLVDAMTGANAFGESAAQYLTIRGTLNTHVNNGQTQAYTFDLLDTNDDDKGDKIIVHPVTVAKVTYAGAKSITAGSNYKFEDHDIADGIKKDDYVVITPAANTAKGRANIVKAEVVTGKINGQKSGKVQVADKWYSNVTSPAQTVTNGDTCDVVVLNGYAFNFDVTAETTKDIAFVSAIGDYDAMTGESDGTVKVRAYFTDGTNKEIKVRKVNGTKVTGTSAVTVDTLYTYKSTDDGYELTTLRNDKTTGVSKNLAGYDDVVTATTNAYQNKKFVGTVVTASNPSTSKTASIADDAVVFVKYKDGSSTDIKVMTGKSVANWGNTTWNAAGQALIAESNGIDYVKIGALVNTSAVRPSASDDALYGYLLEDAYTTTKGADDDDVIAYHIWTGSEDTTVYEEIDGTNVTASNLLKKGSAIRYELDGEYVTKAANTSIYADAATAVAITGIEYKSKGAVTYRVSAGTESTLDMDEDCVYIAVDDENHTKHEGGLKDIATAKEQPNGKKVANAYIFTIVDGSTTKISAIVFDVPNNELDITSNEF